MISDDKLKNAADITLSSECEIVMVRATFIKEMAQELLQQREAERAIWKDAPEWANWFARDAGWFYQRKPQPGDSGEWENLAGVAEPAMHDGWETSLQERPK